MQNRGQRAVCDTPLTCLRPARTCIILTRKIKFKLHEQNSSPKKKSPDWLLWLAFLIGITNYMLNT